MPARARGAKPAKYPPGSLSSDTGSNALSETTTTDFRSGAHTRKCISPPSNGSAPTGMRLVIDRCILCRDPKQPGSKDRSSRGRLISLRCFRIAWAGRVPYGEVVTAVEAFELTTRGGASDFALVTAACRLFGPYCLIGGLAVNCYVEPVYTLDADIVALADNL